MKNSWKKIQSKDIYDNPWIHVQEDQVITPGGSDGIYGTVHFKNRAIGIIPIDQEGNTYLVGQYRYPLDIYSWEIPMGGGQLEGDDLISAQRELKEETGLVAKKWKKLGKVHTSNSVTDEEGYIFVATELIQEEAEPEDTEDLVIKKLPFQQVVKMVINNEITDSISIIGILKLDYLLKNNLLEF